MQILEIAKDALQLTWKRKYLWVFGIFAAIGGGANGGGGSTHGHGAGGGTSGAEQVPGWVWPLLVVAGVAAIAFLVLQVVSSAALIASVRHEREGAPSNVRTGFREGAAHFWTVLGLEAAFAAAMLVTVAIVAAPVLVATAKLLPLWLGVGATVIAVLPAIPWLLSLYFAYQYALRFAVLDGERFKTSVKRAWRYLHGRVADSLQLFALMLVGRMGAGAVMFAAMIPGAIVGLITWAIVHSLVPALIVGGLLALPFAIAVMGAGRVFDSSVWTIGFLESRREVAG